MSTVELSSLEIEKKIKSGGKIGGYDVKLVSKLPLVFKCPICKLLMRSAIQTYRGERACYSCYFEAKCDKNVCPIDKEPIKEEEVFLDKHAIREILQLVCYCPNSENGCDRQLSLNDLENHVQECLYTFTTCSRCGDSVLSRDAEVHTNKECAFRLVVCDFCKESFQAQCFQDHQLTCMRKPVDCPYMCGNQVPLSDIYDHVAICKKVTDGCICPYQIVGCKYKPDSSEDLNQHYFTSITTHASLSVSLVKHLQENNEKLKRELLTEQALRYEMQKQIEDANKERKKLSEKLDTAQVQLGEYQNESLAMKENIEKVEIQLDIKETDTSVEPKDLREINARLEEVESKYNGVEEKLKLLQPTVRGSNKDVAALELKDTIKSVDDLETRGAVLVANYSDLQLKLQLLENTCYEGRQVWKIDNVDYRMQQAVTGKVTALHSAPCYQKRGGYKFCSRLYLNGDGIGKDSHISLFFVLMKSEFDALLSWPFNHRVYFKLINPYNKEDCVEETFLPDKTSSSFRRPTKEMNVAAGCPLFLSKTQVNKYIIDDCLFIETAIDTK